MEYSYDQLTSMKLKGLRELCKSLGIKRYSNLDKEGLKNLIISWQSGSVSDEKNKDKLDKPKKQIPEGFLKKFLKSLDKTKLDKEAIEEKDISDEYIMKLYKSDIESYVEEYSDVDIKRFVNNYGISSMLDFMKSGTKVKFSKISEDEAYKVLCLEYLLTKEDNIKKIVKAVTKQPAKTKKTTQIVNQVNVSERVDISENEETEPILFEETEE